MRRVHDRLTTCRICGREIPIQRIGDYNVIDDHNQPGLTVHCPGSGQTVPDKSVMVVRL